MQRCEAEKADPDQPWHLCTHASQASLQVQGFSGVYMHTGMFANVYTYMSMNTYLACQLSKTLGSTELIVHASVMERYHWENWAIHQ